ncbi:peptide ABC transporter permease [Kaistia sp. 32K]|uniref:ABC transporter substrate-binding protein n=1 Tax=Kaistia sp. 32K TaxID=2795690 RepID=UPI001914F2DF|nr:ABC transporter substrate-binding protein [Kaistia sp. 32K]BCP55547.1 peptide ABC transporter permease [Kaistia sp. 32K]
MTALDKNPRSSVLRRAFLTLAGSTLLAASMSQAALAHGDPKPGGTLTVGLQRQADCIDPQQNNYGYGSVDGRQLVDSLTDQSYSDPTKIVPWLAKSWEISDDATTYVFHLRDDVTFSDGSKFDADIVKRNIETLSKIPGATGAAALRGITSVTLDDPYTIRIQFEAPNVAFLQATSAAEFGIVAAATLAKTPDERCFAGVIGTGPFVLDKVVFNEQTTLVKRPDYNWASELRAHKGPAYLDKVVYRVIPEGTVRSGALQSGQVDLVQNVSFDDIAPLEKAGFEVESAPYHGVATQLVINTKSPVLRDREVRRALQITLNRQEIVDLAFSGFHKAATGLLTANSGYFLDQAAKLGPDPDAGRAILDKAGWVVGGDGVRAKDGQRLSITVSFFAAPANQAFLEVVQQELADIGVELKLRPLTAGAFDEALLKGDYDLHRWARELADPDAIRQIFSTKTANRLWLEPGNPLDVLLDEQRATVDPKARGEIVEKIQALVVDEAYSLPIFDSVQLWLHAPAVHGSSFGAGGTGGPNQILYDVWLAR